MKVKRIGYGVNYSRIRRNHKQYRKGDKLTFLFAGTFIRHKGPHLLAEAFKMVAGEAELRMHGSGPYEHLLNRSAKEDVRIKLPGVFSPTEIGEVLSQIDVVVVPSIWYENTPIILLEALAANVPAIVTDLYGMTEVLDDGVNGRTFPIGDVAQLCNVMQSLVDTPETLNYYKENLKNRFIPTTEQIALAYEREYLSALSNHRSRELN